MMEIPSRIFGDNTIWNNPNNLASSSSNKFIVYDINKIGNKLA
jgi:hypothetical protein